MSSVFIDGKRQCDFQSTAIREDESNVNYVEQILDKLEKSGEGSKDEK